MAKRPGSPPPNTALIVAVRKFKARLTFRTAESAATQADRTAGIAMLLVTVAPLTFGTAHTVRALPVDLVLVVLAGGQDALTVTAEFAISIATL